jgi:Carbonic anhydrase
LVHSGKCSSAFLKANRQTFCLSPVLIQESIPTCSLKLNYGELFILRNAGNIVPPYSAVQGGEAATIEFAVAGLGVKDIIICGHTHCGAMKGLLEPSNPIDFPSAES